jgi:hypothetical protein
VLAFAAGCAARGLFFGLALGLIGRLRLRSRAGLSRRAICMLRHYNLLLRRLLLARGATFGLALLAVDLRLAAVALLLINALLLLVFWRLINLWLMDPRLLNGRALPSGAPLGFALLFDDLLLRLLRGTNLRSGINAPLLLYGLG